MLRYIAVVILGSVGIASVNAGQIQIGQTVSGNNDGLTTTYVTSGCESTSGTNWDGCATGSVGSFSLRAYNVNLMAGALAGSSKPTFGVTPSNTAAYTGTAAVAPGSTITDSTNQITFAMIDNVNTASQNFWAGLNTTQMVIPIGIFGVSDVWTMLNNYYGPQGTGTTNDTSLTFTFASDSAGTSGVDTLTLNLINGTEIRSAVDCSGAGCTTTTYATALASGPTNVAATYSVGTGPASIAVSAYAGTLLTASYTTGATSPYVGTTGQLNLDDQDFSFGTNFQNDWLVSVSVAEKSGVSNVSRTALSGITVVTASPEPSTVFLLLGGFGSIGLMRFRRRR